MPREHGPSLEEMGEDKKKKKLPKFSPSKEHVKFQIDLNQQKKLTSTSMALLNDQTKMKSLNPKKKVVVNF